MPYWIANRGGVHNRARERTDAAPVDDLRRDLPPELASLPDEAVAQVWVVWELLRIGRPVDWAAKMVGLPVDLRLRVAAAWHGQASDRGGQL